MERKDAKDRFQQADGFYRDGRYADALAILEVLDRAYPSQKNILYPRACCLQKLGRSDEADAICDTLIANFGDPRAADLKRAIDKQRNPGPDGLPSLSPDLLDIGFDAPRPRPAPIQPQRDSSDYTRWALIAGGVLLVAILVIVPVVFGHPEPGALKVKSSSGTSRTATSTHHPAMFGIAKDGSVTFYGYGLTWWGAILVAVVVTTILYTINLYLTLMAVGKLRSEDFSDNLADCFATAGLCAITNFFCCLGIVLSVILLRRNYEFGFVDFLALTGISLVTSLLVYGTLVVVVALGLLSSGAVPVH